MIVDTNVH